MGNRVYAVAIALDSLRLKNIIQLSGCALFLLFVVPPSFWLDTGVTFVFRAMMLYGALMGDQIHKVLIGANGGAPCPRILTCFGENGLFNVVDRCVKRTHKSRWMALGG
jgi:hypothetical protein